MPAGRPCWCGDYIWVCVGCLNLLSLYWIEFPLVLLYILHLIRLCCTTPAFLMLEQGYQYELWRDARLTSPTPTSLIDAAAGTGEYSPSRMRSSVPYPPTVGVRHNACRIHHA